MNEPAVPATTACRGSRRRVCVPPGLARPTEQGRGRFDPLPVTSRGAGPSAPTRRTRRGSRSSTHDPARTSTRGARITRDPWIGVRASRGLSPGQDLRPRRGTEPWFRNPSDATLDRPPPRIPRDWPREIPRLSASGAAQTTVTGQTHKTPSMRESIRPPLRTVKPLPQPPRFAETVPADTNRPPDRPSGRGNLGGTATRAAIAPGKSTRLLPPLRPIEPLRGRPSPRVRFPSRLRRP